MDTIDFSGYKPVARLRNTNLIFGDLFDMSSLPGGKSIFMLMRKRREERQEEDQEEEDDGMDLEDEESDEEETDEEDEEDEEISTGLKSIKFVDLATEKIRDFTLNERTFDHRSDSRLYRYFGDRDSSTILILAESQNYDYDDTHRYQMAKFHLNFSTSKLERLTKWLDVVPEFKTTRSVYYFPGYFVIMCHFSDQMFQVVVVDTDEMKIKESIFFEDAPRTTNRNWYEYATNFGNYLDSHFYGFSLKTRYEDEQDGYTFRLQTLARHFRVVVRRSLITGELELLHMKNGLVKALGIVPKTFRPSSKYFVNGDWSQHRFFIHVRAKDIPSQICPLSYFAVLDLDLGQWMGIKVPQPFETLMAPMEMIVSPNDQLILLRSNVYAENMGKESEVEIFRIPIRKPEELMTLCSAKFRRQFEGANLKKYQHLLS